jgi:hypothetical protein
MKMPAQKMCAICGGRYNVRIFVDGKEIHVGNFQTVEQAIESRRQAELKYYGEFAPSLRNT